MDGKFFHKIIFTSIFLLSLFCAVAQDRTTVKATLDKDVILIGEQIQLTLEATIPERQPILFFSIDSIPHFEIIERSKTDTAKSGNARILKQTMRITSFDSGQWVIPSFILYNKIRTDPIPVTVTFSEFDPNREYHDVKEIIEVDPAEDKKQNRMWILIAATVLIIALMFLLLRKKRKITPIASKPPVDPYQEAMRQLEMLQKQNLTAVEFYSKVVDIFRYYILYRNNILSLQKTTDDLVLQLKQIGLEKNQFEELAQSLRLSDFVKFAKYKPSKEDDDLFLKTIKNSIETIEAMK
jgi:hypothetical protein